MACTSYTAPTAPAPPPPAVTPAPVTSVTIREIDTAPDPIQVAVLVAFGTGSSSPEARLIVDGVDRGSIARVPGGQTSAGTLLFSKGSGNHSICVE